MGRRRWLAAAVPAVLLLGVAGTAALRPAVDGCPGGSAAVLLPRQEQVPDLLGLDATAARTTAEQAGVPWDAREETWAVDAAARGTVLEQAGGGCEDPLRLVLSTGGPLVDPADQAPAARRALGPQPGPVRAVRSASGVALQSSTVVTGECDAVHELVATEPLEPAVAVTCHEAPAQALARVVAGASGFLGGPPAGPEDVRVLGSSSAFGRPDAPPGWSVDRAVDGWRLTVLVLSTRGSDEPRCGPASAYEVCASERRADGSVAVSAQVLGERPAGRPYVSLETVLQQEVWRARVLLAPDAESGRRPDRPTAPPADLPTLRALAEETLAAVTPVTAP